MKIVKLFHIAFALSAMSCSTSRTGMTTLTDVSNVNTALPDDYTSRLFFKQTSTVREDLDSFVGSILYVDTAGSAEIVYLPSLLRAGGRPATTPIKDGNIYESKITSDWGTNIKLNIIKIFLNVDSKISNKEAYEVLLQDMTSTKISQDSLKWDKIFDIAQKTKKPEEVKCRCLVMNSILTTILYKGFKEIDSNSNIAAGDAFAANGIKYNSQNNKHIKDYRISYWCYDIDKALKFTKSNNAFDENNEQQKSQAISYLKALASDDQIKSVMTASVIDTLKIKN